ncbi:esterase/lipase family protein [Microbulbifer halophilus]|uniref:Esterase/lipase family protein n=1 Tax=Microbulbifer halophilus TaxID=453963 RepID=A0ABW5EIB1_9GAMM|nr:lipase [Microbulbifer halophilus]MCW8127393.1 lipase [Microbulbifer halophilus]
MKTPSRVALLIPGIFDRGWSMHRMQRALDAAGFHAHYLHLKYNSGWYGMEFLSYQLKSQLDALVDKDSTCALVGFSMGGIVARHYLQARGGLDRVHKFVSLSSPHYGSLWAGLLPYSGGRQLRTGSGFLKKLNDGVHSLAPTDPVSIWTRYDITILPHTSSRLPLGAAYEVPVALHRWVPLDERVIDIVVDELGAGLPQP